jgi:hypothetical protein
MGLDVFLAPKETQTTWAFPRQKFPAGFWTSGVVQKLVLDH